MKKVNAKKFINRLSVFLSCDKTLKFKTVFLLALLISSIFLGLFSVPSVKAEGESWLLGYSYRKSHVINQTSNTGTNYPVQITVINGSGADSGQNVYFDNRVLQSNFSDVAFTDLGGVTKFDYWQDSSLVYNGLNSTFYVEVSGNLSLAAQTIYVYVGSASVASLSNGINTFLFFEDFNSLNNGDLNGQNGWTGSTGFDVEATTVKEGAKAVQFIDVGTGVAVSHSLSDIDSYKIFIQTYMRTTVVQKPSYQHAYYAYQGTTQISAVAIGTTSVFTHLKPGAWETFDGTPLVNTWYKTKLAFPNASSHKVWLNDVEQSLTTISNINNVTTAITKLVLECSDSVATDYFDCVIVGKYVSPEPAHGAWGAEEETNAPSLGAISANNIVANAPVTLSCSINSIGGYNISSHTWGWNNTGTLINASAVAVNSASLTTTFSGTWNSTTGNKIIVNLYANNTLDEWSSTTQTFTLVADTTPPTITNVSASPQYAGQQSTFTANLTDNTGISGYIFWTDNTGYGVNDTWVPASGLTAIVNVTKTVNSTVGALIRYKWYCNDTNNNWEQEDVPENYLTAWNTQTSAVITLGSAGQWDDKWIVDPYIVKFGNEYRAYYTGGNSTGTWSLQIGYANSTDMKTWTKQGIVLAPSWTGNETSGISTPNIIQIANGTYYMYYHTVKNTSPYDQPALATSQDGLTWTKYNSGNCLFSTVAGTFYSQRLDPEAVFYDNAKTPKFIMIFIGYDGSTFRGGRATSNDGVTWVVDASPVLSGTASTWDASGAIPVGQIGTNEIDGIYYLFYQGTIDVPNSRWKIGIATSNDTVTWTKYAGNPVIDTAAWDTVSAENPSNVILVNGEYVLLYCGTSSTSATNYVIGFANITGPMTGGNPIYNFTSTTSPIFLHLQLPFDNETSTTAYDWGDYENNGIITGTSRSYDGHFGMGLSFDGNDYVTVIDDNSLDFTSTIVLSAWIKPTTLTESVIFDKPNSYGLYLTSLGDITMMVNDNIFGTATAPISTGSWYHIVGEYTGTSVKIYINETLKITIPYTEAIIPSAFDLIIGDAFVGIIDECQITTSYSSDLLNPIATYPYAYSLDIDTTACSWIVSTLTYNFTTVYIQQNSSHPLTYAKFNFTDGVDEIGLSYTVSTTTFNKIGGGTGKVTFVTQSVSTSNNAFIMFSRIRITEVIQTVLEVDVLLYCEATGGGTDSLLVEDRFGIYGIGGTTTTTIVGDGSLIAGGSVFDIMAQNSSLTGGGSSIRVDTVAPNFQHIHILTHLYQTAQWDNESGVWDCPTFDSDTGYLEYGVDYMQENCTWITGWKVRISVLDGAAGTGVWLANDASWVRLNVTWYNNDTIIKADEIYAMYEAYRDENDTTTQFSLYIDLWLSELEGSTNVAGHVSSQYYGMEENGWWLWSTWGPVGGLATSSTFYDNLYDGDGNITYASNLKMFRVWSKIAKIDSGEGATSCDEHLWASINEVLQIKQLPYNDILVGIMSPVFMPTTTPDMPVGFFASLGNYLANAIEALRYAIVSTAQVAGELTSDVVDTVFSSLGVQDFTSSITSSISSIGDYFATAFSYITSLIVTFFTLLASIGMFIITWFGYFVNAILSIGTGITNLLSGKSVPLGGFQIEVLGQFWTAIATLITSGGLFIILVVYWFDSLDKRAKQTGGGWMSIFMSDIQSMISVFSFILDLAFRVVNFVIDTTMRFINFFL